MNDDSQKIVLADFKNDGRSILEYLIRQSGWKTLSQALASLVVFAHPDVVASVGSRAVFRTKRGNIRERGQIKDGLMMDDNYSPATAFVVATRFKRGPDLHCCHLFTASNDSSSYTDLRNVFFAPTFLAKLTDYQTKEPANDHLSYILRYRAWELYGYCGPSSAICPSKPSGYEALVWADPIGAGATPESAKAVFINFMGRHPKDRLALSVHSLGWTFSDYEPDPSIAYVGATF